MYGHLGQHKGLGKLEGGLPGKLSPWHPLVPNTGNSLSGPEDNLRPSSLPCGWILFIPLKAAWSQCKLCFRDIQTILSLKAIIICLTCVNAASLMGGTCFSLSAWRNLARTRMFPSRLDRGNCKKQWAALEAKGYSAKNGDAERQCLNEWLS